MGKSTASKKSSSGNSGLNFEAQLWAAADKMRGHMDASEYKYVALSLNRRESRTLAALRGALLPKLLSGALRVPATTI